MSIPMAAWRAHYTPGEWLVLSGPTMLVVMTPPPARMAGQIETLWQAVLQAPSADAIVALIAEAGLGQFPDLGAFFWEADTLRGLTRGRVRVLDADTGNVLLEGERAMTWREDDLGGERRLRVDLGADLEERATQLPLVVGAVYAAEVRLTTAADELVRFADDARRGILDGVREAEPEPAGERQEPYRPEPAGERQELYRPEPAADVPAQPAPTPEDSQEQSQSHYRAPGLPQGFPSSSGFPVPRVVVAEDALASLPKTPDEPPAVPERPRPWEPAQSEAPAAEESVSEAAPVEETPEQGRPEAEDKEQAGFEASPRVERPFQVDAQPSPVERAYPEPSYSQPSPMPAPSPAEPAAQAPYPGSFEERTYIEPISTYLPQPEAPNAETPKVGLPEGAVAPVPEDPASYGSDMAALNADTEGSGMPPVPGSAPSAPEPKQGPVTVPPRLGEANDNAGTIFSSGLAATHKPQTPDPSDQQQVLAVPCVNGHANAPGVRSCRLCHAPVDGSNPRLIRRPVLAGVHTNKGEFVDVIGGVVVGRAPDLGSGPSGSRLLRVISPSNDISRNHVLITTKEWNVVVTDLHSTNGTTVVPVGEAPFTIRDGMTVQVDIGTVLDLGDGVSLRIEPPRG